MIAFKITGFEGIKPRVSPRLLSNTSAQGASNCTLVSGEIYPMAIPKLASSNTLSGSPILRSIYNATSTWLMWDKDVDVTRSPLPGVVRFIYSGDGEPRLTTETDRLIAPRSLGIPKPSAFPSLSVAAGTDLIVTRRYCYTFYDDLNQESGISPLSSSVTGSSTVTWTVATMDTSPLSSGTGTVTVALGVTTFTNASSSKHWLRVGDEVVISSTTVVVSEVVSVSIFRVVGAFTGATSWARKAPWGTTFTKRIYRTSGTRAQFQLVASVSSATVSYADAILDKDIPGDELITTSWDLPPVDLKGVITLSSGAICGFSGNEICFSEPFQPHAWPAKYKLRSPYPIVAIEQYTSGIVVGTTGIPMLIVGHEPGQMSAQPIEGAYPCVAKRSIVSVGDKVAFATAHGMLVVGDGGTSLFTQDWFSRDEWVTYTPQTMVAEYVRGRMYVMAPNAVTPVLLIFDMLDQTGLTTVSLNCTEIYADPISGKLFISDTLNRDIRELDPTDGVYMEQVWLSKEFIVEKPINFGAARVNFTPRYTLVQIAAIQALYDNAIATNNNLLSTNSEGGDIGDFYDSIGEVAVADSLISSNIKPEFEGRSIGFTLYVNGAAFYSAVVNSGVGFSLPSGYKSDTFAVKVQGQSLIKSIDIAETFSGLERV